MYINKYREFHNCQTNNYGIAWFLMSFPVLQLLLGHQIKCLGKYLHTVLGKELGRNWVPPDTTASAVKTDTGHPRIVPGLGDAALCSCNNLLTGLFALNCGTSNGWKCEEVGCSISFIDNISSRKDLAKRVREVNIFAKSIRRRLSRWY